jgi:outer membrane receptor protein involved in Fe transport
LHSKTAPTYIYFQKVETSPNQYIQPNKKLDFIKAQHFVVGYDWNISQTLRVKLETYYQDIFQAIVEQSSSSYSMLNASSFTWFVPDSLTNGGNGRNYGLELTFEKFLDKGFYFLFTGSLFDSKYRGSDNVLRSTAFDSKYVVNLLAGNEFEIFKKENAKYRKWITFDGKLTVGGGQRYTPIDLEESMLKRTTVYYDELAYSEHFKDYFRADIRIAYKLEGKKTSQEWAVDIQNITNKKNPLYQDYDADANEVKTINQLGVFPMVQYRITF